MQTSFPGSNGFTLLELLVVVIIIGIMGAIAYPSISHGMASLRYTKDRQAVALFLKRSLILSRMDGHARIIEIDPETDSLKCGKKSLIPFHGQDKPQALLINGEEVDKMPIVPFRFFKAGIRFKDMILTVNLYDGKVDEQHVR